MVLRFRESVEQSRRGRLVCIVREIAEVELELQQVDIMQDRLREQRERDLAQTLPAVHLVEVAERELELKKVAEGCAPDCGNLKPSGSSSWPSIRQRIRTVRFSANSASNSGTPMIRSKAAGTKDVGMICFWRGGNRATRHTLPSDNRQALPSTHFCGAFSTCLIGTFFQVFSPQQRFRLGTIPKPETLVSRVLNCLVIETAL